MIHICKSIMLNTYYNLIFYSSRDYNVLNTIVNRSPSTVHTLHFTTINLNLINDYKFNFRL